MILTDVMDELVMRLGVVPGLRAHDWSVPTVVLPAAVVHYPKIVEFETYLNGMESYTLDVVVLVGKLNDRGTRQPMSDYLRPTGPTSIREALQTGHSASFDVISIQETVADGSYPLAGTEYQAIIFTCKISGSGK